MKKLLETIKENLKLTFLIPKDNKLKVATTKKVRKTKSGKKINV